VRRMERRILGRTGISVPAVGLGTARVFNVRDDAGQARCEAVIDAALQYGANLFDTSPMYGEAEQVLASALIDRRPDALVATKVWARTRAIGEQQIERALDWFGTVDLYQVHNLLSVKDYVPVLVALKRIGRVRSVGITHYLPSTYPDILELMRSGFVDVIQIPYHPGERAAEGELLPEAERLGIGVIAMTPFASGRALEQAPPEETLASLASAGVHTWNQALLKWVLSDPRVSCTIPATSRPEHMRENALAGRGPWLTEQQRAIVAQLYEAFCAPPAAHLELSAG
jgi:diketogulonate reductase-like aldo/keto reductase